MEVLSLVVIGGLLGAGVVLQHRAAVRLRRTNAVLSAAMHEAANRGHGHVTLEHLMLFLSFDEDIEALLASKGVDAERMRESLEEELARVTTHADRSGRPLLDSRVELVIKLASIRRSHPTPRAIFDAIAEGPDSCARRAVEVAATPISTPQVIADSSGPYRSPPAPGTTAVRYWNDRRTPVAFVIASLCEHVGTEPSRACYFAYRVHFEGSFAVARREMGEATEIAAKVMNAARANGFPLRVTTDEA